MLVDEHGDMLHSSQPASSQHAPASPAPSFGSFGRGSPNGSSPLSSLRGSPVFVGSAATSPVQSPDGPQKWLTRTPVMSTDHGEAVFIRLGRESDFVNNGRARIEYLKLKRGTKFKKECHYTWVVPETLTRVEKEDDAAAIAMEDAVLRKSPRREAAAREQTEEQTREQTLPKRAAHERDRKLPKKAEAPVRGPQKLTRQTPESKVPVSKRIEEFSGHSLFENPLNHMLRCAACSRDIPNKHSQIVAHIKMEIRGGQLTRHATNMMKWKSRATDDADIKQDLVDYFDARPDELVGTKDVDELLYRYRVAESFVCYPPFEGINHHRPLLQRSNYSVPEASHLKKFIPKIELSELKRLNSELVGQYIGVAFDGTTRLGEAINTTGRWCTEDFVLVQRLLDFTTLETHVDNQRLAAHITNLLMQRRGVPLDHVINLARDSCAVNGAACRRLKVTFSSAADSLCFCHTLCHVGERFELLTLKEFKTPWLELVGGRDPHRGAQTLWKEVVAPAPVPGYSKVRWYSWAEILFVIAEAGMNRLGDFIGTCEQRDYGDATRLKLRSIYDEKPDELRLELAAMLDMRKLVSTTYELEGDRLEVLLVYDRVEALRSLGCAIRAKEDGVLPNVDCVLRRLMTLKKGVKMEKHYNGHGICTGTLEKLEKVGSGLYPGQECQAWLTKFADGTVEHFEVEELRSGKDGPVPNGQDGKPVLVVRNLDQRNAVCEGLIPGFDYLEARVMGTCDAHYSLVEMYELCRVARAFDPTFAAASVDAVFVDAMVAITPLRALGMLGDLKQQLPHYLAAARNATPIDKASITDYSDGILEWWRHNGGSFKAWAVAARIVFAIAPNSASCERVFALLKNLFGDQQLNALADYVQSALMLNYNDRQVG